MAIFVSPLLFLLGPEFGDKAVFKAGRARLNQPLPRIKLVCRAERGRLGGGPGYHPERIAEDDRINDIVPAAQFTEQLTFVGALQAVERKCPVNQRSAE